MAARLPALVLGGDLIGSLALLHKAIQAEPENDFRAKLRALQGELERSLLESSLVLSDGEKTVQLMGGDSFTIGRESPSAPADVAIPCRWLSRGTKNLRLYRDKGRWMVSDLGSTNGHFLDGVRLKPREGMRPGGRRNHPGSRQERRRAGAGLAVLLRDPYRRGRTELRHGE